MMLNLKSRNLFFLPCIVYVEFKEYLPFNEFKDLALVHPGCIHRNTCTFIIDDDDDHFKFY